MHADLQQRLPLAAYTTIGVGGPAEHLLEARTNAELERGLAWARQRGTPVVVLGQGSNVIVSDAGLPGLVIVNQRPGAVAGGVTLEQAEDGAVLAHIDGGVSLARLAHWSATMGASGLEWAANLPGTVAGAVVGNAGAFGGAMADSVTGVTLLLEDGSRGTLSAGELEFAYRGSLLRRHPWVVTEVELRLAAAPSQECLTRLAAASDERRRRQPPGRSAGSIFRNPAGSFAGALLEQAGMKGMAVGDAVVSSVHANFIINRGAATAGDVLALMGRMRRAVYERAGVLLEAEVELLGDLALEAV